MACEEAVRIFVQQLAQEVGRRATLLARLENAQREQEFLDPIGTFPVRDEVVQPALERQLVRNRCELPHLIFRYAVLRIGEVLNQVEGADAEAIAQHGPNDRIDQCRDAVRSTNPRTRLKLFCHDFSHFSLAILADRSESKLPFALTTCARRHVGEHVRRVTRVDGLVDHLHVCLSKCRQIIHNGGVADGQSLINSIKVCERKMSADDSSPS